MTFYHFVNCVALAYVPYHLTYKAAGLSEYGAFWKCATAGGFYMVTQLIKMLFLATFFPSSDLDDEDDNAAAAAAATEVPFVLLTEFLKATVDLADLAGLHLVMQRVAGKGQVKVLVAGLGWAFAELVLTRVVYLWFGARGVEFDWKYTQNSLDANVSLAHFLTLACLVWLATRRDINASVVPFLAILIALCSYKSFILESFSHFFLVGVWTSLLYKALATVALGLLTLQIYIGVTAGDKY